jgi:hypothetical protein
VKLLTALDAGMLAAARALGEGSNATAQAENARAAAAKFFAANFPTGYWGTTNLSFPSPAIDSTSVANYRSITGTASADAPLYFLRVFGASTSTIRVTAQAARRDALVVLVLDRSGSMDRDVAGTGTTACEIMKRDATEFMKYFAPGRDKLALVVFNSGTYYINPTTSFDPTSSSDARVSAINSIVCIDNTGAADALNRAYKIITDNNESTRANVIVFMTDGIPNGVTGDFVSYRISGCGKKGTPMIGVLAQWANNGSTGDTAGLMARSTTSVSGGAAAETVGTDNCRFLQQPPDIGLRRIDEDVTRMPTKDYYGNALAGTYSSYLNDDVSFFGRTADLTRVTSPQDITRASANALDNQATAIRSNTTLKPMIYTIGLNTDPTGLDRPDEQLLRKIANDSSLATAPNSGPQMYEDQKNQPRGLYVNAPDASQLGAAFETLATHIVVRLAL